MKKVTKPLAVLALSVFLGSVNPVVAQSADTPTTTNQNVEDDDNDDNGKYGLAGLLGLLGLLGLRKKDGDDKRYTTTTPNR